MKNYITIILTLIAQAGIAQNAWTTEAPFEGDARNMAASFVIDDKLYIGTGTDASLDGMPDFWSYDPVTEDWVQLADFEGDQRFGAVGFSINGKGYVALGAADQAAGLFTDIWEYDPDLDDWTQKASFEGTARMGAVVFVIGNKAYVGSGQDANGKTTDFWEFNPVANDWVEKAAFPGVARSSAAAFTIGAKGYVGTGADELDESLTDFWEYNPSTNQWVQKANYSGAERFGAASFTIDDHGFIGIGGNESTLDDFWAYDAVANTWHQVADFGGSARFNAVGAAIAGKGYVGSGTDGTDKLDFFEHTPKISQTITFGTIPGQTFGTAGLTLTASASSTLTVSYTSSNAGVATISGTSLSIVGAGSSTITAIQAGNASTFPAASVERELVVAKANQTITFNALASKAVGDLPFALTATASSTLPVTYESSHSLVASISGSTVTIVGGGTTTITASQAGNTNYNAAINETEDLVVDKANQTITFNALPAKTFGDPAFQLTATASSTMAVTLASSNTSVATISGSTITIVGAGSTDITANQAGNNSFNAAPPVIRALTVAKANQTIVLENIASKKVDSAPFTVAATSNSGLTVTLTSGDVSVATVSGNTVTITGAGQTLIIANQPGDANYNPAPAVTRVLNVAPAFVSAAGQGELWGIGNGGSDALGVIYKTNSTGSVYKVEYEFQSDPGGVPSTQTRTTMIEVNGKLYGVFSGGGENNAGVFFEIDVTTGIYTKKFDFSKENSRWPTGKLALATNGKLYGVTSEGSNRLGAIFECDIATGVCAEKYTFSNAPNSPFPGTYPSGGLTVGPGGKLYGTTPHAGSTTGNIYEYDPVANTVTNRFSFTSTTGTNPKGELVLVNGKLYGCTTGGGTAGNGVIYEFDPVLNTVTKHHDFTGALSNFDAGPIQLTLAPNGKLYGTTIHGNTTVSGSLFEFDPVTKAYSTRFQFDFTNNAKGLGAGAILAVGPDSKLYGAGSTDAHTHGMIYSFDPANGQYQIVSNFTDGFLNGGLTVASNGKLYGFGDGGAYNSGQLYEFSTTALTFTKKQDFALAVEGHTPRGNLALASNGKFYGIAAAGSNNRGILFEYDPQSKTYAKKIEFPANSGFADDGPVAAPNGKLYGILANYDNNNSTIYEYTPATNTFTPKFTFSNLTVGTNSPYGELAYLNGKLYSATYSGSGTSFSGVFFDFDIATSTFTKRADLGTIGTHFRGKMVLAPNGKLYGTMSGGGANAAGTIIELDPVTNVLTKKRDMETATGSGPNGLTLAPNGKFYGTTSNGGTQNEGTVFEYDPVANSYTKKFDLTLATGSNPFAVLEFSSNGKLYGTTTRGGTFTSFTTILEFDPASGVTSVAKEFPGTGGFGVYGALTFRNSTVADQTITFPAIGSKEFGATFELAATSSSGLPVTYSIDNPAIATISGSTVTLLAISTAKITAKQAGNDQFHPAQDVTQTLTVIKGKQTITFDALTDRALGGAKFTLAATASSGLPVTFATGGDKVSIFNNEVTIVRAGLASITASQAGDFYYEAALPVVRTFCISPAKPIITFGGDNASTSVTLTSNATAGNQWYFNGNIMTGQTATTLTATDPGIYKVQVSLEGCVSEFSSDFAVIVTGTLLSDTDLSLRMYPNPVSTDLYIVWPAGSEDTETREVALYDILGRHMGQQTMSADEVSLDVRSLQPGTYVLRAQRGSRTAQRRFVKD